MIHLLKIEWLKVKNYRAFWIFVLLYFASIFLVNYFGWSAQQRAFASTPGVERAFGNAYAFPKVWQTVGWMSSWLLYFPGMLMIMLMTNEFTYRTHRQNIIDGLSRQQFIGVKVVMALLLAILITLVNFVTATVFGNMTGSAFTMKGMENMAYVFLQALAYIFFALMLAVLFRRSGLAIIVFILYGLIFEWLITGFLTFKFSLAPYSYFLPLQVSDVLIPIPFGKKVFYPDTPSVTSLVIGLAAYLFLYLFFTRKKFVADDL